MTWGLLSVAPSPAISKYLESLSAALDATSQSIASIEQGMDTFHAGLRQLYYPALTPPEITPGTFEDNETQENMPLKENIEENDSAKDNLNENSPSANKPLEDNASEKDAGKSEFE